MIKLPNPLSGYLGNDPMGGENIQKLERAWEKKFQVKHAIAVNSATSGLLAACMACEISTGMEVIVSPFTMSATAAAPAVLGADIVFADIDETFTLDPLDVHNNISMMTRAVIVTNLFGHPGHLRELRDVCDDANIWLIEDNSQAICAKEDGIWAGTIGHMGVFSLNVHKHIQTGEGGVVVTNDDLFANRLRGAMNHGEMRGLAPGLNLRMTEITAMMALEELKRVDYEVAEARAYADRILDIFEHMPDIVTFPPREGCEHSYYCLPFACLTQDIRDRMLMIGAKPYVEPLYNLPAFRPYHSKCPEAEATYDNLLVLELCHNPRLMEFISELSAAYA